MVKILTYYVLFFLVVEGEPVVIPNNNLHFNTIQDCLIYAQEEVDRTRLFLNQQPESFITGVCLARDFQKIGNL